MRLSKSHTISLRRKLPESRLIASPSPKRPSAVLRPAITKTSFSGNLARASLLLSPVGFSPCARSKSITRVRRKQSPKNSRVDQSEGSRGRTGKLAPLIDLKTVEMEYGGVRSAAKSPNPARFSPNQIKSRLTASGKVVLKAYERELSDFEAQEVQGVKEVYFLGRRGAVSGLEAFDDEHKDYQAAPGDHLCYRYEVLSLLGCGSFGRVWKCFDHKTNTQVAVKIIKNDTKLLTQGLVEAQALEKLLHADPLDSHYVVRIKGNAHFRGHFCLVFELLCYSLYELLKSRNYEGLPLPLVRKLTWQMVNALAFIGKQSLIHCDLKPENVMLSKLHCAAIKLIDFGSCCFTDSRIYTYIQSRFYRSPEVILGIPYTVQIDMWSLGCVVAELSLGLPIFPGENEQELVAMIVEVIGLPKLEYIRKGSRSGLFFEATGQVKVPERWQNRRFEAASRPLASLLRCSDAPFLDFITGCLQWDPATRLTPDAALLGKWLSG